MIPDHVPRIARPIVHRALSGLELVEYCHERHAIVENEPASEEQTAATILCSTADWIAATHPYSQAHVNPIHLAVDYILASRAAPESERAPLLAPAIAERFAHIATLKDGWDGYGALRPCDGALNRAENLANVLAAPPSVVPLSDGGIQLEWHRLGLDIEIRFASDNDGEGITIEVDRA